MPNALVGLLGALAVAASADASPPGCDAEVIEAVDRVPHGEDRPTDVAALDSFVRSDAATSQPDLLVAALAAEWLIAPERSMAAYQARRRSVDEARAALKRNRGVAPRPCLGERLLSAIAEAVMTDYRRILASGDARLVLPAGALVDQHVRFRCFQRGDCQAAREVDQLVHSAIARMVSAPPVPPGPIGEHKKVYWFRPPPFDLSAEELGDACSDCRAP